MAEYSSLLTALSGFAWPALILVFVVFFRNEIKSLYLQLQRQLASGAALKWKDFEFRAIQIDPLDVRDGTEYIQEPADHEFLDRRHKVIERTKIYF